MLYRADEGILLWVEVMARLCFAISLAALTVLSVLSLDARLAYAWAEDADDCMTGSGDARIQGCSRIIKSGRLFGKPIGNVNLAIAYNKRGITHGNKVQYDHAIADFNKAISLNQNYAKAYNNRGYVYAKKGDHDRAIADFRKALKLDPSIETSKKGLERLGVSP